MLQREQGILLGVAGVDVPVKELLKLTPAYKVRESLMVCRVNAGCAVDTPSNPSRSVGATTLVEVQGAKPRKLCNLADFMVIFMAENKLASLRQCTREN